MSTLPMYAVSPCARYYVTLLPSCLPYLRSLTDRSDSFSRRLTSSSLEPSRQYINVGGRAGSQERSRSSQCNGLSTGLFTETWRTQIKSLLHVGGDFSPSPNSTPPLGCAWQPAGWGVGGCQRGLASLQPENVVYSGPSSPSPKRVTLNVLKKKYHSGEPISMVTAYDYPSAVHVDQAQLDVLLVGDSVGMVVHGHDTTLPVTLDDMLVHCRAVARGAKRAFLVGDLPFGSYEASTQDAIKSAVRMLKEGGMDAVKLEGGSPARVEAARAIVETGVAVMGHVGLTPQSISAIGGFRPQAQAAEGAQRVLTQALALQDAGCFSLVLECVPALIAATITAALSIPTIGIGAGPHCSGQVLVYHDLLGMMSHPHHAKVTPKFCKQYSKVGAIIQEALQEYRDDVATRRFPSAQFSPYKIAPEELHILAAQLKREGLVAAAATLETHIHEGQN